MDVLTAVLSANLLTAMFIYGGVLITKSERNGEPVSMVGIGCMLLPLAIVIMGHFSAGHLPPYLDALAAR